jgi:AcrR family transcriptional regulator
MAFTARSEGTRSAILVAARQLLVEKGYDATTIRAVASVAGIDPSMVMRYYGSKEGLFSAALEVDLQLPKAADCPRERAGEILARHLIRRWEGELADELVLLLLRSASTNSIARDRVLEVFRGQVLDFVREITGNAPDTITRATMIGTQVLGVALCRYVLELPPIVEMDRDELAARLGPVLQHYLTGDPRGAVAS